MNSWEIRQGDCLSLLRAMPDESVQTCVTSPPYWGLRDYGDEGQLGLEPTPEQYVENLVEVFREVRRVLRADGTLWLNLGDSYAGSGPNRQGEGVGASGETNGAGLDTRGFRGLKPKDLVGIPWRVAFALQADGWYLRSDIIWAKPNPMPESVTDRPTKAHEYLFLLAKQPRYFYDAEAIREDAIHAGETVTLGPKSLSVGQAAGMNREPSGNGKADSVVVAAGRNKRSVWTVTTQPYSEAHFATFPPKLIEPCILAGSPPKCCGECGAPWERRVERETSYDHTTTAPGKSKDGPYAPQTGDGAGTHDIRHGALSRVSTIGWRPTCAPTATSTEHHDDSGSATVLDPFAGSGTTGLVALRHDRSFIGLELNPAYCEMARNRIRDDAPLFNYQAEVAP